MSSTQRKQRTPDHADLNEIADVIATLAMSAHRMRHADIRLALVELERRVRKAAPLLMRVPAS